MAFFRTIIALVLTLLFFSQLSPVQAAGVVVITDCSNDTQLRNAASSSGATHISFNCGTAVIPISAYIQVSGEVVIDGAGKITLDGQELQAFFQVYNSAKLELTNLTLQNGRMSSAAPLENFGELSLGRVVMRNNSSSSASGAINNYGSLRIAQSSFLNNQAQAEAGALNCQAGTAVVQQSTFANNQANSNGGAIYSLCDITIHNSTFDNNRSVTGGGGAIYQSGSGKAEIQYSTISNNSGVFGAGIYNDGLASSTISIRASMLSENSTGDCDGVITSLGHNLASDNNCGSFTEAGDAKNQNLPLGPLANNGGPTQTRKPLAGNPAIDAISGACGMASDQIGTARPANGKCDIGALEVPALETPDPSHQIFLPVVKR